MLPAHYVVDLYWQVFLVLLCCSIVPPVFSCSVIPSYSDCSASVLFALQIIYILKEITLIYNLLIRCNLYADAIISLQFKKKINKNVIISIL